MTARTSQPAQAGCTISPRPSTSKNTASGARGGRRSAVTRARTIERLGAEVLHRAGIDAGRGRPGPPMDRARPARGQARVSRRARRLGDGEVAEVGHQAVDQAPPGSWRRGGTTEQGIEARPVAPLSCARLEHQGPSSRAPRASRLTTAPMRLALRVDGEG